MKKRIASLFILSAVVASFAVAQTKQSYDSSAVAQIIKAEKDSSDVLQILGYIADVYGPRLTWSPAFMRAAGWAINEMKSIGLANVHLEGWTPMGKGWELKQYWANVIGDQTFPLISYPKAWSPNTEGTIIGELIYLKADSVEALKSYRGKLKGKFVLLDEPRQLSPRFQPLATRTPDSTLLKLANAGPEGQGFRLRLTPEIKARIRFNSEKLKICEEEGAAAILTESAGDDGNVFVQQASVPVDPDTPYVRWPNAWDENAPKIVPQISVGAEHYNRLLRMIEMGVAPKIEMNLQVEFTKADSGYDVIGEIPGTDLKDEVVMIGGHFDSWHGGTGATDNGTGSAVCLEAMRLIKELNFHPRRTIRIALWGGEEEGLLGSRGYVKAHFGEQGGTWFEPEGPLTIKPEAEKFQVYFNDDNGAGKFRGIYLQNNEAARTIFREWLRPFESMGASTISFRNTGGTDHLSFDAIGLPGFQFIQDPLDYGTITHHSIMDVYDRAPAEDLKQSATIMAAFAYNAAMMDGRFPRKTIEAQTTSNK